MARLSLGAISRAEPWWSDHDLLFAPQLSERSELIAGRDEAGFWLFMEFLAAAAAAAILCAIGIWGGARRSLSRPAFAVLALQLLSLPMLFGALTADSFQPAVQMSDGQIGWIVWEDPSSVTLFVQGARPVLIRHGKSERPDLTVIGFERILHARVEGSSATRAKEGS